MDVTACNKASGPRKISPKQEYFVPTRISVIYTVIFKGATYF